METIFVLGIALVTFAQGMFVGYILRTPAPPDIVKLEEERLEWANQMFPEATAESSLLKLIGEVEEIQKDLAEGKREPIEYADCMMCIFDSGARQKVPITPTDIINAFKEKLEINKNREWKKNPDNTYSHVKKLLTLLLIVLSSICPAQVNFYDSDKMDSVVHSLCIIEKTNRLGAPALYIKDGAMTVNDSLESIKALLDIVIKKDSVINSLWDELYAYDRFVAAFNGFPLPENKAHFYYKERNIFLRATNQKSKIVPCQCDICLLKNHKKYRKEFYNK